LRQIIHKSGENKERCGRLETKNEVFSSLSVLPITIKLPGQTAGALEFGEGGSQQHIVFEQFLADK